MAIKPTDGPCDRRPGLLQYKDANGVLVTSSLLMDEAGAQRPYVLQCVHEGYHMRLLSLLAAGMMGETLSADRFYFTHTDVEPELPEPTNVIDAADLIRDIMEKRS